MRITYTVSGATRLDIESVAAAPARAFFGKEPLGVKVGRVDPLMRRGDGTVCEWEATVEAWDSDADA